MKPDFIGIGAQKCATSWLHEILHDHSDIFMSDPKEIDFFSYYFDKGYEWYERHFAEAGTSAAKGETSPSYFYNPAVPERVAAYNPDTKLILALRDPVERAFSNHLHEYRAGNISPGKSFLEGIENNPCYIEQSRYAKHLEAWRAWFSPEQMHIVIFEEIRQNPQAIVHGVYDFLGVEAYVSDALMSRKSNSSIGYKSKALQNVIQFGGHAIRRAGFTASLERVKANPAVSRVLSLNKVDMRSEVPVMTAEDRAHCTELLRDDVNRLCAMLEVDSLPWPNFFDGS
ncbi:MAG: sulfotransferase [Pseudomonadota bacterium]